MTLTRPSRRSDLTVVVLDGEAVVYDDVVEDVHHLNPSATAVFQLLDGSATLDELADDIVAVFGLDRAGAMAQVRGLIDELATAGLLEGTAPAEAERER